VLIFAPRTPNLEEEGRFVNKLRHSTGLQKGDPSMKNIMSMEDVEMAMAASRDPMTSLSIHRSTLQSLQELKTGAETWDMFLERLAMYYEDTLTPELRSVLRGRSSAPRVPLRDVLRQHEELKRRGR
jgi:hypothetical protein